MHLQYGEVRQAQFLVRPNQVIAHVDLAGEMGVRHVQNTGRCRGLLDMGGWGYLWLL